MNLFLSRHRLTQALLLSFCFHIGLLLLFSISFFIPSDPLTQQVDIQLDVSSPVSLASLEMNTSGHPRDALLASCGLASSSLSEKALMACTTSSHSSTAPLMRFYTPPDLPWEPGSELMNPIPSAYPMKITLQKGLQTLFLTEDGSSLFKPLTDDMTSYTPIFPDSLPRLSFLVTVDPRTGRIIESHSEKEFADERLQNLSETILKELRFQSSEGTHGEPVPGELILQFAATFEGLAQQLKNPEAFL